MPAENENLENQEQEHGNNENQEQQPKLPTTPEELEQLLEERLKGIKGNLDKAYAARDAALEEARRLQKERNDAEIKRLEEEGKHREAAELRVKELQEQNEALQAANTTLARDNELTRVLAALPQQFRNARAQEMARQEIQSGLVKNEKGQWVHKSGVSIEEFALSFAKDENNSFLFKQKESRGAGMPGAKPSNKDTPKKLSQLSQEEVLQLAREGKLPSQR